MNLSHITQLSPIQSVERMAKAMASSLPVLRALVPRQAIPGRCRYCWTDMELVYQQITEYEGGHMMRHYRYWECPMCEDRITESNVYLLSVSFTTGDIHDRLGNDDPD